MLVFTRYLCPTNFKGARIVAESESGVRRVYAMDSSLSAEDNHLWMASEVADIMGFSGVDYAGCYKDKVHIWVCRGSSVHDGGDS